MYLSDDILLNIFKFMSPFQCQNMQKTNSRIYKIINCEYNSAIKYINTICINIRLLKILKAHGHTFSCAQLKENYKYAIKRGKLEAVIYFSVNDVYVEDAIDLASRRGHLNVVEYLHNIGMSCTINAMNWASENGHFVIVQYLHNIGKDCTENAMNNASRNGHLDVVKYLHGVGKNCTEEAMIFATQNGHLDIIKHLHSIGEKCTKISCGLCKTKLLL